jgi:hypothetical protein
MTLTYNQQEFNCKQVFDGRRKEVFSFSSIAANKRSGHIAPLEQYEGKNGPKQTAGGKVTPKSITNLRARARVYEAYPLSVGVPRSVVERITS